MGHAWGSSNVTSFNSQSPLDRCLCDLPQSGGHGSAQVLLLTRWKTSTRLPSMLLWQHVDCLGTEHSELEREKTCLRLESDTGVYLPSIMKHTAALMAWEEKHTRGYKAAQREGCRASAASWRNKSSLITYFLANWRSLGKE